MPDANEFAEFLRRIRAGDQQAAVELVQQYEPFIRREVRTRLRNAQLSRLLDSMDLCQSVLASFFVRVAAGDYELEQPQDLLKLLVVMTRNKLAYQARKHHARRRDNRRIAASRVEELEMAAAGPSPSQIVAGQELLREFCRRLTTEERQLMDLRNQGRSWNCVTFLQAAMNPAGPSGVCLRLAEDGTVRLTVSDATLNELREVLSRPEIRRKRCSLTDEVVTAFLATVARVATSQTSVPVVFTYARDPKDEPYVNLAITMQATYLVSFDDDLLDLMKEDNADGRALRALAPNLVILTPPQFLRAIRTAKGQP